MFRSVRAVLTAAVSVAVASAAVGCARPLPGQPADPVGLAVAPPFAGPLTYEEAVRRAVLHSPELQALRLAMDAAGGWPPQEPVGLDVGADSDGRPELGLEVDLLSVLGLGPQRAERVLARLRRTEAGLVLHARTREVAIEIAEAYAIEMVLSEPSPPFAVLDPEAFVQAGLAPEAANEAKDAVVATLAVDALAREAAREAARLRVKRHLGLLPESHIVLVLPAAPWPRVEKPDARSVLASDPAVLRKVGAYEVSRGTLLRAQANRDPGLVVKPALALDPAQFFGAVSLRLPVGAGSEIRAAHAGMEAARLDVRAAVLEALEEANTAQRAWEVAEQAAVAARSQRKAALALNDAERARVQAQGEGFTEAVLAGNAVVDATTALREALIEAARARVRAASSSGWPLPTGVAPVPCGGR
jgi:hypothetical protein